MNQITSMFMESNKRMKEIMTGHFRLEQVSAAQREFEGQIKLLNAIVSAFGIASKNKRALTGLEQMNIMSSTEAVNLLLGSVEDEHVKCENTGKLMTRNECLDYSGHHHDDCGGCEVGKATKEILLPADN
jgi:hypothetical protein